MIFLSGYSVFLPGNWDTVTFIFSYAMVAVLPAVFIVWKLLRRTRVWLPFFSFVIQHLKCRMSSSGSDLKTSTSSQQKERSWTNTNSPISHSAMGSQEEVSPKRNNQAMGWRSESVLDCHNQSVFGGSPRVQHFLYSLRLIESRWSTEAKNAP